MQTYLAINSILIQMTMGAAISENGVLTHIPIIGPYNTEHLVAFAYFFFFLCAMQCCLFLAVSQWHGLSTNYRKSINVVQSLAISLPQLQFTMIIIKTLAIVYIRTFLQRTLLYWQHDKAIWLSYLYTRTCHSDGTNMFIDTDLLLRDLKDFEQDTGFCR